MRGERRLSGAGLSVWGVAIGVLFLVVCRCVLGAACSTRGAVGLVLLVTGRGTSSSWITGSPSEVATASTL